MNENDAPNVKEPVTNTETAKSTTNTNHTAVPAREYNDSLYGRPHFKYYDNHRTKSLHTEVEQSLKAFCKEAAPLLKVCHPPIIKKDKVGIHITRSNIPEFRV